MTYQLTTDQIEQLKTSYLNIVALFLARKEVNSKYFRCLLKWGFQLHIGPDDLRKHADISALEFNRPEEKKQRAEELFNLVAMIYLDRVVEDVELEVATLYAEKLGFPARMVSELFTAIATAEQEGITLAHVRQRIEEFMKMAS